ncbi:MAG: response regulator [Pseudomonas sp.]
MSQQPVRILFVDDEERILRTLAMQFRRHYQVFTESDPQKVMALLQQQPMDIVVSDQRMPGMSGSQLLAQVQQDYPHTLRILLTGYSDLEAAVEALNSGGIFRYLTKPWVTSEMVATLAQASNMVLRQRASQSNVMPISSARSNRSAERANLLLLDNDPQTLAVTQQLCVENQIKLFHARSLDEAVRLLNEQSLDMLVSDIQLDGNDVRPLLMTLAQAHPQLLSIIITPFQDTQVLLKLINQAQIFRYLPKPIRRGMYQRAISTALAQVEEWRQQPAPVVTRLAATPVVAEEQSRVNGLMGMLGRLRQRLTA